MSLRYQINVRILLSSLCILLLGGSIAVWQARQAVNEEIDASVNMAAQLIRLGFSQTLFNEAEWLKRINSLKETRHLEIQLQAPSGQVLSVTQKEMGKSDVERPPQWFIALVGGKHSKTEQPIITADGKQFTLLIRANPLDEITEVWGESVAFFISLSVLTLLTFLAVHLAFDKALKSIAIIVNALENIEKGDYRQKLPEFSTLEYDSIAKAINHMTDELNKVQQENRALAQHSLEIQEDERQRLAQELHDELGQSLTAIKVMAATAAHQKADIRQTTEAIVSISNHLMSVVRSMMHQLHPLVLTELGLKAAIEDLLSHWSARHPELHLSLDCSDQVDGLNQKITIQIFRVVQECLTNIVRHAEASEASIAIRIDHEPEARLRLEVRDNGRGCEDGNLKAGFGLLGMRERIQSLGGEFSIDTELQQGMRVAASIPLANLRRSD
ncbi:LapD/MoxY N-terminal periplasmic domain-containing protein [Methylomicrobium agile]|uniref:LapD/MoxY N-terminal periplasmic domain-containing protein n=1 Tax=Methylomicrobium agile TaxID=39774 RepID=UPI0004DEDF6F|nr:LapD/MoxY N-terminal periplasmic domain-containing protein [Methylomicrobium agile]